MHVRVEKHQFNGFILMYLQSLGQAFVFYRVDKQGIKMHAGL